MAPRSLATRQAHRRYCGASPLRLKSPDWPGPRTGWATYFSVIVNCLVVKFPRPTIRLRSLVMRGAFPGRLVPIHAAGRGFLGSYENRKQRSGAAVLARPVRDQRGRICGVCNPAYGCHHIRRPWRRSSALQQTGERCGIDAWRGNQTVAAAALICDEQAASAGEFASGGACLGLKFRTRAAAARQSRPRSDKDRAPGRARHKYKYARYIASARTSGSAPAASATSAAHPWPGSASRPG
jgi:hypothetical protein